MVMPSVSRPIADVLASRTPIVIDAIVVSGLKPADFHKAAELLNDPREFSIRINIRLEY